ncbi:hypothetical protein [Roseofilum sp. Belize Diploria]|uniref:hypothetical protein n=1 Tax=Roseofilum sp. Belize Diploria TaxID=2821501 RepID=UPI001B156997|nr:hypothetical protein [Roseofilum sp. Belize Diploria]MBP0008289.1 hypothetical protein [Roseofilum sp. Belize Diploria]
MDTYIKQAWNLVTEYFHSNQIEISKYVDHELVRTYLKAGQKSAPKGIRIVSSGNRLYLRFKTATKPATVNNSCNEDFTRERNLPFHHEETASQLYQPSRNGFHSNSCPTSPGKLS